MRNAVTLGVRQDFLDTFRRHFKLFRDFGDAHAIVEVVDDRTYRQPRTAQHRSTAVHSRFDFDERTFRPVDLFLCGHGALPATMISCFPVEDQEAHACGRGRDPVGRNYPQLRAGETCRRLAGNAYEARLIMAVAVASRKPRSSASASDGNCASANARLISCTQRSRAA